ncbi:UNVERIFIED_CONTAM: hypothetical protein Scaly_1254700 [Sesamum calycinum]|uniref:Uncharacterized protein n=1 Tax=Sesamum calycinum TaxID=2727403 RepID=A0AAW2Q680_9LAMI
MLSTENPPPDLPCPCEISQLKSSSSNVSDERASDHNNLHQLEVDLLKSGLDDNNNPLPQFSISVTSSAGWSCEVAAKSSVKSPPFFFLSMGRTYIVLFGLCFNTRGKDIKNNWPFSQKNLQLCLKYGVKDVLPPFQSLDSVRNPSTVKCAVENISYSDVKLSELSNHGVGQNLGVNIENIKSSGSEEDLEVPSSAISHSCSDINSVAPVKKPCLETEAEYSLGSHKEKPRSAVHISNKVESNIQQKPKTMASKVCPVCKTFSSSSNTTLNAHIDQCLSGESTIKWTTNSKVIKHRIKPRKTRLMVDIYETAQHCTLEDLDRRNGTNWASNFSSPLQDFEVCAEEKQKRPILQSILRTSMRTVLYTLTLMAQNFGFYQSLVTSHQPQMLTMILDQVSLSKEIKKANFLHIRRKNISCPGRQSCQNILLMDKEVAPKGLIIGWNLLLVDKKVAYSGPIIVLRVSAVNVSMKWINGYRKDLTEPLTAYDQMKSSDFGMIKQWQGICISEKDILGSCNYTRSKKFSSSRKKLLSVRHASAPESKKKLGRKHLNLKKPRPYYTSGSDEEAVPSQSEIHAQDNPAETLGENAAQMEMVSVMPFIDITRVLKIRKKREGFIEIGKGDMTLKGSETSRESNHHGVQKTVDSFIGGNTPVNASTSLEEVEIRDQFVCEPTYKIADGETFVAFSKSLDSAFHGIVGPSNVECVSQHYSKSYEGHCPAALVLGEMGADESQGNYFVDVDPIPIPGPPGSFLPSPGRMGSEELQGNSSLTTCRIQSSEDDHEVVDMDSSDSPISAMSAASNSVAARSDSVSVINMSVQSHGVPHETPM